MKTAKIFIADIGDESPVRFIANFIARDFFDKDIPVKIAQQLDSITITQDTPYTCEKCGRCDNTVVIHHVFGRRYKHILWDPDNRSPLCCEHHTGSSEFSTTRTPSKYINWIIEKRGPVWWRKLIKKARRIK